MSNHVSRRRLRITALAVACALQIVATHVFAKDSSGDSAPKQLSVKALFARAWQNHPAANLSAAIDNEANAKLARADSWLAGPPTLDAGIRSDAISRSSRREGLREIEFEVSTPIATPLRRSLQSATATAEAQAQRAALDAQRLKLAGEIREAYWAVRVAKSEFALAEDEAARASALAADSARRTRAGESARVDTLQAEAAAQQSNRIVAEARGQLSLALALLTQLLGDTRSDPFTITADALAPSRESKPTAKTLNGNHAVLTQARLASVAARARLDEATRLSSEAPAAKFTLANERTQEGGSKSSARIGVSIPFDATFRIGNFNAPRVTQAARELAQADADRLNMERTIAIEIRAAELALETAEARVSLAKRRAELTADAAALYEKAFRLGDLDLPTRLRSEGERANAVRDAARAELDVDKAISRLQQALGNLP